MAVHFSSSKTVEWATPQDFFDKMNAEFGFTLDAAATAENAKCARYLAKVLPAYWGWLRCQACPDAVSRSTQKNNHQRSSDLCPARASVLGLATRDQK
jgi:hypothetical protein